MRWQPKQLLSYIKGDWMEHVTTLSFTSWTHNVHPCPMCFCSPNTMYDLKNFTLEAVGWDLKTIDHYIEECERREIHVVVDGSKHAKIRNSLRITHRRERGGRARELIVDIPEYGLRAHDKLEPTPWMSDYAVFDATTRFPAPFVFWRADEQAWTQHRNPLFDRRLGLVPQRMHCRNATAGTSFTNSWSTTCGKSGMQRARCVQRCRSCVCETSLFAWYSDRERAGHRVYKVENLTASMFANSSCHMKGAETSSFLGFVVVLADRWKHAISDGVMLWNAGVALDSAIDLCRQPPWVLPPGTRAQLCYLTARHLDLMARCHVHQVPKCHAFLHFSRASDFLGNPWLYTTFEGESQNRRLAMIAAGAHRAQWYRRVLLSWRQEFGDRAQRSEREPRRRRLTERSAETQ